jgi:hypothetical protein
MTAKVQPEPSEESGPRHSGASAPPRYSIDKLKGLSMKRSVIFIGVWSMGLAGLLASVAIPSSASAQLPVAVAAAVTPGSFTPLPMARVFDGKATTTPRLVQIAGRGGVPTNATAVMVNTEVSAPTAAGYVRVTPAGQNPGVATQEFAKGQLISNLVAVKLVGGKIQTKVSAGSARILMDVSGYYSAGVPVNPPNTPGPVTGLSAIGVSDTSIALAWTNPTDASFTGVTIRRAPGASAPATVTDGTSVSVPASATATSFTDTGLTAGTQYSYAVFAHDGVPNFAAAANATGSTTGVATGVTTAVLKVSSNGVNTTHNTVGAPFLFDAGGSLAGPAGTTITAVSLNFGDGTTPASLTGDPAFWWEAHSYVAAGTYSVTLTVTDSGNVTASKVVTVTVSAAPTAAIAIQGDPASVHVGVPVTFALTSSTPPGTAITSWTVYDVWLDGGFGTPPPATVTHTFDAPGTYTVQFDFSNDAVGLAQSSTEVTVLP